MKKEMEIIEYLVQEIKETEEAIIEWDSDNKQAQEQAVKNGKGKFDNWQYKKIKTSRPPKSIINNNIKKIRKLLLKMYV